MFGEQNSWALLAITFCRLVLRSNRECMCNSRGIQGDGFMKIRFSAVVLAATLACSSLATAQAQNAARVYDNGPVWWAQSLGDASPARRTYSSNP